MTSNIPFLIDSLYEGVEGYPKNGTYLERFLFYRSTAQKEGVDADVCKGIMEIYLKSNPFFQGRDVTLELQPGCKQKWQIVADGKTYRGETLVNCMQFLLQIANYENCEIIRSEDIERIRETLNNSAIMTHEMQDLLERFIRLCYSPGNFIPIPYSKGSSLNCAKQPLKEKGYGCMLVDSEYVYLKMLFDYFGGATPSVKVTRLIDSVEEYGDWKNRYRKQNGKDLFISDNKLDPFVKKGEAIQFWKMTGDGLPKDAIPFLEKISEALEARSGLMLS